MGRIIEATPETGEYSGELRRESIYLSGSPNWTWSRVDPDTGERVFWDDDIRPEGDGWDCGYHRRRHALALYQNGDTGEGTVEILIEDIPKIRAFLDLIEAEATKRR